jgi:di/tricarboxylate transporter
VLGAGLKEAGVATLMARAIQRLGGHSEARLVVFIMLAAGLLSAFMSNAAVVAILLPVGMVLSRRSGVAPSRLLMPMAFAAVLGGTITLIGTAPNILVAGYLVGDGAPYAGGTELHVFDFARVGVPLLLAGMLFMATIGRRMLPVVKPADRLAGTKLPEDVARSYELPMRLFELRVVEGSGVAGRTIGEADVRNRYDLSILMVRRPSAVLDRWIEPEPTLELLPEDRLYMQGDEVAAWEFCESELLQFGLADAQAVERLLGHGTTLAEVAIPPHSRAVGRTLKDLHFRRRFGLNVLAILRRDSVVQESPREVLLEVGDCCLVSGPADRVHRLAAHPDYTVLTDLSEDEDVTRAPLAIALVVAALIPPILHDVPLAVSALGAALLMVATGCVSQRALRRAVDWNVIFLIVGTLPLGRALDQHHVASIAATWIADAGGLLGVTGMYGILFLVAAVLAVVTSNAAAAVIMAPVAAKAALSAGLDLKATLLVMGYGCSCAFVLPFAQCNLLVMAPGGYRTRDFVRVGLWMSLIMAAVTILMFAR